MTASAAIEQLLARGEDVQSRAAELIRNDPEPRQLLLKLAKSRLVEVRGWVAGNAADVLGSDALPILLLLLDDDDADIRVTAVTAVEGLDPSHIPALARRLRRRLRSSNPYEALATSWTLAKIGDKESVEVLRRYRDGHEPWTWQHKAADVVLLYMTAPDEVVRRIEGHDHDRMLWLAYAAKLVGTPSALAALRSGADTLADEECRAACRYTLENDV